jgi:hypothetical protein
MASVFFSYSHADEALRDQLEKHLSALKQQGLIEIWHDRRIPAGDDFDHTIRQELERADLILLLVSSDFLASRYCNDVEVRRAMERHQAGEARVIPVILRYCDWHGTLFGKLATTPRDGKPVKSFPDLDEGFLQVTQAIKAALIAPRSSTARAPRAPATAIPVGVLPTAPGPRSSNLRIRKSFTDADRDRFKDEAFAFMAKYFENSLVELQARHEDIEASFKRIDAQQFTATVYRGGKKRSSCRIFIGAQPFAGGICFSANEGGGINESLSIEADNERLFLKSLDFGMRGDADRRLTFEGAAELYWNRFLAPLRH